MTVELKSERRRKEQLETGALRTWLVSLLKIDYSRNGCLVF